ncbi:MarR family winged helix-turn-helix transcriptional regulator [Bacillus sp. 1P06AnD]|uniref:MarR family winged helix-turn-helix transcriptional regulator n=1 Tax=Bacillus sp. 1P06AnD TaxID=3132208 RepID=UPI0039A1C10A
MNEEIERSSTAELILAFMQFHKLNWQRSAVDDHNPSEMRLLISIFEVNRHRGKDVKAAELSRILHISPSSVTQLLNKLEKDGLLMRQMSERDRRSMLVSLTDEGIKAADQGRQRIAAVFEELVGYLGEKDSRQLTELMNKVFAFFNQRKL